jgi:hypothetical protein
MAGAYPWPVRLILAGLAAVAVGTLGALILGEYPFTGVTVLAAAVIFGLFISEAAVAVARSEGDVRLAVAVGVVAAAATTWAAWISTGRDLSFLGAAGWTAVGLAAVTAGGRTIMGTVLKKESPQPEAGNPPVEPAPGASPEERSA